MWVRVSSPQSSAVASRGRRWGIVRVPEGALCSCGQEAASVWVEGKVHFGQPAAVFATGGVW